MPESRQGHGDIFSVTSFILQTQIPDIFPY